MDNNTTSAINSTSTLPPTDSVGKGTLPPTDSVGKGTSASVSSEITSIARTTDLVTTLLPDPYIEQESRITEAGIGLIIAFSTIGFIGVILCFISVWRRCLRERQ
jgi:hypothetical protein